MRRIACGLVALAALAPARADELSSADKLRILYSRRFTFTRDGVPLITIGIVDGRAEVRVSAPGGLRVLPDGEGGPEVRAASDAFVVRVLDGRPAKTRFWPVLGAAPARRGDAVGQAVARARDLGLVPRVLETGSLFAVAGAVIDRRTALVVEDAPLATPAAARARAAALAPRLGAPPALHEELAERPSGVVEATSEGAAPVRVRNEGVLWFAPATPGGAVQVDGVPLGAGGPAGASQRVEARRFLGRIVVAVDPSGRLTVVNEVPEDRLLAGLVPAEIYPDSPDAALRAQAVAARSELLAKIGTRHSLEPYLLCATQHCQVYAGAGRELPRTTAAVTATRGEVLLRPDGDLVDTVYSASCGGAIEGNDPIWGGAPDPQLRPGLDVDAPGARLPGESAAALREFLLTRPAAACDLGARDQRFRWQVARTPGEWGAVLAASGLDVGPLRAVDVLTRSAAGRALAVRLRGDRATREVRGDFAVRRALGGLRSSLFLVEPGPGGALELHGAGFGHGVGMCQSGAIGRARRGDGYRQILERYYRGAVLTKLY